VPWRGDSALTDSIGDFSLVGGWYDSGDNIKNSYTIATTVTFLAWSLVEFSHGYKASGNLAHGMDLIKWGSDYLVKCHTEPTQFIAQVGCPPRPHLAHTASDQPCPCLATALVATRRPSPTLGPLLRQSYPCPYPTPSPRHRSAT
jgi:hypothetical protein